MNRLIYRLAAIAVAAASLAGSAAAAPAAATTYNVTAEGAAYGPGPTQKATIYRPDAPGRRPVAYMVHGGGWVAGGRAAWDGEATVWASRGWLVVNLDYTRGVIDGIGGDGRQMKADIVDAVRLFEADPQADKTRQVIMGDSAGGHLATLAGAYLASHFDGIIAWSPVAIPAHAAEDGQAAGAPANVASLGARADEFWGYSGTSTTPGTTDARRYIDATGPIRMLIFGSRDEWVSWDRQGGYLCGYDGPACTGVDGTLHGTHLRDAWPSLAEQARSWALARIQGA